MRNNRYLYWLIIGLGTVIMTACSSKDEPAPEENKPLIILDTDIGSSTDDLFAMQMLYDYDRRGLCKFLGVIVNRVTNPELVDAFKAPGVEILSYIPADSAFAANDIMGRSVMELPADSSVLKGVQEALRNIEIL